MSNHVHLVYKVNKPHGISDFLSDFKKFHTKEFIRDMNKINESRKDCMKRMFSFEARRSGRAKRFKIWKDDNHAIWMHDIDFWNKINYFHNNSVAEEIVDSLEDYI